MLSVNDFQFTSLILSIIAVLSMIIIGFFRKNARLFYLSLIIWWIPGIIYYIIVIYFNEDFTKIFGNSASHLSAFLRAYQYFVFGSWFTFDAIYLLSTRISNKLKIKKVEDKVYFLSKNIHGCGGKHG